MSRAAFRLLRGLENFTPHRAIPRNQAQHQTTRRAEDHDVHPPRQTFRVAGRGQIHSQMQRQKHHVHTERRECAEDAHQFQHRRLLFGRELEKTFFLAKVPEIFVTGQRQEMNHQAESNRGGH